MEGVVATANPYCDRLGIPVPDLAALARRPGVRIRSFVVGALLERGGPMTIEEIVDRLAALGVRGGSGDLRVSVQKGWHGPPIFRDAQGRFGLDPSSIAGLPYDLAMHVYCPPAPPPDVVQPSNDVPLSPSEVLDGFHERHMYGLPDTRQAAAVLEALGRPMLVEEVEAFLHVLTPHRHPIRREHIGHWKGPLVRLRDDGYLELLSDEEKLRGMRKAVRKVMLPALREQARRAVLVPGAAMRQQRLREEAVETQIRRRAVLHGFFHRGRLAALTVLDVGERAFSTFVGDEVQNAAPLLRGFDLLVGLEPRKVLDALQIEAGAVRLVDLALAPKSRRINRQGRVLRLTPSMLMRGSLNVSRPLGDPKRMASYAVAGDRTRLVRRLEGDAKALLAYYRYGVLQRGVRLRWGFLDEILPVEWAHEGDLSIAQILGEVDKGRRVEVVLFTAPGWEDPWARARRVVATEGLWGGARVEDGDGEIVVPIHEVQAARVVEESPPRRGAGR